MLCYMRVYGWYEIHLSIVVTLFAPSNVKVFDLTTVSLRISIALNVLADEMQKN